MLLVDFCTRLAAGMMACLLLLSPVSTARPTTQRKPLANPVFFRTHFLIVLGLSCLALLFSWQTGGWPLLAVLGAAMMFACAGSVSWSLERSPGGVALIVVTAACLVAGLVLWEWSDPSGAGITAARLAGDLSAAALLGAATSAMLMGHSYLVSPTMSITPLYRLLAALAAALGVRVLVDGFAVGAWLSGHSWEDLPGEASVWLPVRWGVGLAAPLVLCWMAWQTARIRSTQSATGILYVVVIFCFLGELTGQLLREYALAL